VLPRSSPSDAGPLYGHNLQKIRAKIVQLLRNKKTFEKKGHLSYTIETTYGIISIFIRPSRSGGDAEKRLSRSSHKTDRGKYLRKQRGKIPKPKLFGPENRIFIFIKEEHPMKKLIAAILASLMAPAGI